MGIRVTCPSCGKQLNVKNFLAGKRGVCPDCRGKFDIPGGKNVTIEVDDGDEVSTVSAPNLPVEAAAAVSAPAIAAAPYAPQPIAPTSFPTAALQPASPQPAPMPTAPDAWAQAPAAAAPYPAQPAMPAMPQPGQPYAMPMQPSPMPAVVAQPMYQPPVPVDPITEAPQAQWYVRPPVGGQFGPAVGDIMRQWIHERRVTPDSLVWREGWADWQRADMIFPALAVAPQGALPGMVPTLPMAGSPVMMPAGPFAAAPALGGMAAGVDPLPGAFPTEEVVRPTTGRNPYRKRTSNNTAIWLTLLIIALLVLAPLFGYVVYSQMR